MLILLLLHDFGVASTLQYSTFLRIHLLNKYLLVLLVLRQTLPVSEKTESPASMKHAFWEERETRAVRAKQTKKGFTEEKL